MSKFKVTLLFIAAGVILLLLIKLYLAVNLKKTPVASPVLIQTSTPSLKAISSLEKIKLGGIEQWIYINSNDTTKPVLLFLHGGPGYPMLPLLHELHTQLEDHFVVVNWDQRGAGLSYAADIPKASMTLKQFVADTYELTSLLQTRFMQKKILLVAHSFGTVIGMMCIKQHPADYLGFVGIGQVTNIISNEQYSYDFVLQSALETKNAKALRELKSIGRPNEKGEYQEESGYDITEKWIEYFGGDIYGQTSLDELDELIFNNPIYVHKWRQIERGMVFSGHLFNDPEVTAFDLVKQFSTLQIPVYLFAGRHDYDTPSELARQYFNNLNAPRKQWIWFEKSAHFPFYEEPEKFRDILINKVWPDISLVNDLPGLWTGTYTTMQQIKTVAIRINKMSNHQYQAEFSFGPSKQNPSEEHGKFKMNVTLDADMNTIRFTASEWVQQPADYKMINLSGSMNNNHIQGAVLLQEDESVIGDFLITKSE